MPSLLLSPLRTVLSTAALALAIAAPASAAKLDTPWTGTGTGTVKVTADATKADPRLEYDAKHSGSWTFSAKAATARSLAVRYEYTGFHSWFSVRVALERYVVRKGVEVLKESLVNGGPVNCCTPPSGGFTYTGTSTFDLQEGDVYGFRFSGSNGDWDPTVKGALTLRDTDASPPTVTPVVTGAKGTNGFYTGPVSVKWTVADDDARVTTTSGCDESTLSEDTDARTYTCEATSAGGTTSRSVTIRRDATAPELTVPSTQIQQATSAGGAPISYTTSATDELDPAPTVTCSNPSGGVFPVGTTSVECTAADAAGNTTTKRFDAIVFAVSAPAAQPAAPAQPRKIDAVLSFRFTILKQATRLVQLKVKNIPAGSTVTVSCTGRSCPKKLKGKGVTKRSKGTSVSLATLVRSTLKGGTTINVSVSSPGAITSIKTLVVRKGKAPKVKG